MQARKLLPDAEPAELAEAPAPDALLPFDGALDVLLPQAASSNAAAAAAEAVTIEVNLTPSPPPCIAITGSGHFGPQSLVLVPHWSRLPKP